MLKLSNRQYDISKWLVQVGFPAFSTFYLTLGQLWGLPAPDKIVGTLAAFATFFGVVLGINSKKYQAETASVDIPEETPKFDPSSDVYDLELYNIYKNTIKDSDNSNNNFWNGGGFDGA